MESKVEEAPIVIPPIALNSDDLAAEYSSLVSYLPASVVQYLSELIESSEGIIEDPPLISNYETVVLFVDVSGFTALSEQMVETAGDQGAALLAQHLNAYLAQIVKCIGSQGGDVFKFAGDAMIVLWPPSNDDLVTKVRKATQSAIEIQSKLSNLALADKVVLNVKIGIGVGTCAVVLVGGVRGRMEYFATGTPLQQAFEAEHRASATDISLSSDAWKLVEPFFEKDGDLGAGFVKPGASKSGKQIQRVNIATQVKVEIQDRKVIDVLRNYVPGAVLPFLNTSMERWLSELRRVSVLFINIGLSEEELVEISTSTSMDGLNKIQDAIRSVQESVYKLQGSLNKFMFDDKGSTLLAVFGLPPLAHINDSLRAVLAALQISSSLQALGLFPAIGVTTGTAFCGVTGAQTRREYSVLGDVVNLSARLMQHAKKSGGGVLVDNETQYLSASKVSFQALDPIQVKGKKDKIKVFFPVTQGNFGLRSRHGAAIRSSSASDVQGHAEVMTKDSDGTFKTVKKPKRSAVYRLSEFMSTASILKGNPEDETHIYKSIQKITDEVKSIPEEDLKSRSMWQKKGKRTSAMVKSRQEGSPVESWAMFRSVASSEPTKPDASVESTPDTHDGHDSDSSDSKDDSISPRLSSTLKLEAKSPIIKNFMSASQMVHASSGMLVPSWVTTAIIKLPREVGAPNISFQVPGNGTIHELKIVVLQFIEQAKLFPKAPKPTENSHEWLLLTKVGRFPLEDESLRVDCIPILVPEVEQSLECMIELEIVFSQRCDRPLDDGRFDCRYKLCKAVNALLSENTKSCMVLEAETGYGKTRLISTSICESPVPVFCCTANPLEERSLSEFQDIVLQIVDFDISLFEELLQTAMDKELEFIKDVVACEAQNAKRRKYFENKLSFLSNAKDVIGVLNDVFEFDFIETDVSIAMDEKSRSDLVENLLLAVIDQYSRSRPLIIVVDDGAYLDARSWKFLHRLFIEVSSMFLLISTPPMNIANMPLFTLKPPDEYDLFLKNKLTTELKLKPLPNLVIYGIAIESLGVTNIPKELSQLLIARSRGNALVCKELIFKLRKEKLINIIEQESGDQVCILSADFDGEKCPVPSSMHILLGCRLDRLSKVQQLLLKTASIIGSQFSFNLLSEVYPIPEHKPRLGDEMKGLVELNIVSVIEDAKSQFSNIPKYDWRSDVVYRFVDGFMQEVLHSRVLEKLYKPIESYIEKIYGETSTGRPKGVQTTETITDFFEVSKTSNPSKKRFTRKYKMRYIRLNSLQLVISDTPSDKKPWRVINLNEGTRTYPVGEEDCGKPHVLCIESNSWIKKDTLITSKTVFFFLAFKESYMMQQWSLRLKNRISPIDASGKKRRSKTPTAEEIKSILKKASEKPSLGSK